MKTQEEVTRIGNPRKPEGTEGEEMLERMNQSHYEVTGWALSYWEMQEDDRVLDIGCGGGATLHRMAEKVTSGHVTGVDYSDVSVETSRRNNEKNISSGKMDVLEGSVENLPFADDSFDKIITVESFYFWPDPQENLKEVRRVLKEGGTFLLVADTYNKEGLDPKTLENICRFHLFTPTAEEFRKLFEKAGFTDIQIHVKEGTDWICVEGKK